MLKKYVSPATRGCHYDTGNILLKDAVWRCKLCYEIKVLIITASYRITLDISDVSNILAGPVDNYTKTKLNFELYITDYSVVRYYPFYLDFNFISDIPKEDRSTIYPRFAFSSFFLFQIGVCYTGPGGRLYCNGYYNLYYYSQSRSELYYFY